jgi:hypothetical protein
LVNGFGIKHIGTKIVELEKELKEKIFPKNG